jgi:hypothetical protein
VGAAASAVDGRTVKTSVIQNPSEFAPDHRPEPGRAGPNREQCGHECPKNRQKPELRPDFHQKSIGSVKSSIDAGLRWRYSQGQIPDLVAYANPRSRQRAQCFGSCLSRIARAASSRKLSCRFSSGRSHTSLSPPKTHPCSRSTAWCLPTPTARPYPIPLHNVPFGG